MLGYLKRAVAWSAPLLVVMAAGCGTNASHRAAISLPQAPADGTMVGGVWVQGPQNVLSGERSPLAGDQDIPMAARKLVDEGGDSLRDGNWLEAVRYTTAAINLAPSLAPAYVNRSWAYIELGQFHAALLDCRKALEIEPELPEAHNNMGLAYHRLGEIANAAPWYRNACNYGISSACWSLSHFKERGDDLVNESAEAFAQHNYDAVIEKTGQALALNPDGAQAYINRSGALLELGRPEAALKDAVKAVALAPHDPLAYNNLGIVYELQGELSEARLHFQIGCDLRHELACANLTRLSDKKEDWYEQSRAGLSESDWLEAVRTASAAISRTPNDARAYTNRCWAYTELGLYPQALDDCRRALALEPDLAAAYNNMALAFQRQENFAAAADSYRKACALGLKAGCTNIAQERDWIKALIAKSVAAFEAKNYVPVKEMTTQVIAMDPENVAAYNTRSGALSYLGELEGAVADGRTATGLAPADGLGYNNLGFALELQKNAAEARVNYEISCRLGSDLGCGNRDRLQTSPAEPAPPAPTN